jgi:hypothetical protein
MNERADILLSALVQGTGRRKQGRSYIKLVPASGCPSALTAQLIASIRRGRRLDAEDLGAVVYFWWKTSTNCNCYDGVTVTTDANMLATP